MKPRRRPPTKANPYPVLAILAASLLPAPWAAAQDFYIPPPSTVDSHVMNLSRENLRHQRETDKVLRRSRSSDNEPTRQQHSDVDSQVENLIVDALESEARRRSATMGRQRSQAWFQGAARDMGRQMGTLQPEYKRRLNAQGQDAADRWLLASAREQVNNYIRSNR